MWVKHCVYGSTLTVQSPSETGALQGILQIDAFKHLLCLNPKIRKILSFRNSLSAIHPREIVTKRERERALPEQDNVSSKRVSLTSTVQS